MPKEVKKSSGCDDFYLCTYDYIASGKIPSKISSETGRSKQNISYYTSKLKRINAIRNVSYGVWGINNQVSRKEVKSLLYKKTSVVTTSDPTRIKELSLKRQNHIRGHGFRFVLRIPRMPNWNKRRDYLTKHKIPWWPIGSKNWEGERILVGNFKIWLTVKSVIVYFPKNFSIIAENAHKSNDCATVIFFEKIRKLESLLSCTLSMGNSYKYKPARRHFALMRNELARLYNKEGKKLFVSDENGRWLIIDNSFNIDELELVNKDTSPQDTDNVIAFFNSLHKRPTTVDEIYEYLDKIPKIETKIEEREARLDARIKSLEAMQVMQVARTEKVMSVVEIIAKRIETSEQHFINQAGTFAAINQPGTVTPFRPDYIC